MCQELLPLWNDGILHAGITYRVAIVNGIWDGKGFEKVTHTQGGASLEGCNACDFGGFYFANTVTYPFYSRYTDLEDHRRQRRPGPYMFNIRHESLPPPVNRTYEDYVVDAARVQEEGLTHSRGVKGLWALHVLPYAAHIVKSKDVAHCAYHIVEVYYLHVTFASYNSHILKGHLKAI
jgi:hypothetical protein